MATCWYYQRDGRVFGPVSFHELVVLVKDGLLSEDDFVRPEYRHEWQYADTAVGLFEMARKVPRERLRLGTVVEGSVPTAVDAVDGDSEVAEIPADPELQQWFQEQLAATSIDGMVGEAAASEERRISSGDGLGPRDTWTAPKGLWQSVVAAAVERFEARHSDQERAKPRWWQIWRFLPAKASLNGVLRLGFRCIVAVGVGWITWSLMQQVDATEALRFPGWRQKTGVKVVPILGECSPAEYAFFAWDLVVVMAIVGYAGARWVERHAQDV